MRSPIWQSPTASALNSGNEATTWALGPFRCFVHDTLLASILANLGVHEIGGGSFFHSNHCDAEARNIVARDFLFKCSKGFLFFWIAGLIEVVDHPAALSHIIAVESWNARGIFTTDDEGSVAVTAEFVATIS